MDHKWPRHRDLRSQTILSNETKSSLTCSSIFNYSAFRVFFFHTLVYSVSKLDYSSEVFFSLLEKSSYIWIRPWSNSHWDERFLGVKTDKRTTSTDLLFGFSKYSYYDRQKIRNFVSTWQDRIYRQLIDTSWNSRISYKEKKTTLSNCLN